MKIIKNDLFDYENRYIYQSESAFKFSLDSLLLAEYTKVNVNNKSLLIDFCTGNCPLPLIISKYFNLKIKAFEIQPEIAKIARMSIGLNDLSNNIEIIQDTINNAVNYVKLQSADVVTCNPPYFKDENMINNNSLLSIARHEIKLKLEDIFVNSYKILKENGKLLLVHRANRLDEIIISAAKHKMKVKEIILISTNEDNKPSMALIKCVKNSNYGLKIYNINIKGCKTYKDIFKEGI